MELVALLSTGKGTWSQVVGLIKRGTWDKVILVGASFLKQKIKKFGFTNVETIFVNFDSSMKEVISELKKNLKNRLKGPEVALNISSGTGKEHMALITALLQLPVGIKFVVLTKEGIVEF